jgi:prophage regulatory protein
MQMEKQNEKKKKEKKQRRLIRRKRVLEKIPIRRTALRQAVLDGKFPPPIVILGRTLVWDEDEVDEWVEDKFAALDASAQGE